MIFVLLLHVVHVLFAFSVILLYFELCKFAALSIHEGTERFTAL
jgi:hypothetical protein